MNYFFQIYKTMNYFFQIYLLQYFLVKLPTVVIKKMDFYLICLLVSSLLVTSALKQSHVSLQFILPISITHF